MKGSAQLFEAIKKGNDSLATMLVEEGSVDPNSRDELGLSPLHFAAARGSIDLMKALLKRGARPDERGRDDQGPLFMACITGHAEAVRELLKAGVSPSSKYYEAEAVPGIVVAATRNHMQVINELLVAGAWIDETDAQGHTALHTACFCGNQQSAVFLVERGANVNLASRKGATPLAWAAHKGHVQVAKALLDKGANVDGVPQEYGHNHIVAPSEIETIPLLAAARADKLDVLKLLLDRGANKEAKNESMRETALHVGAKGDSLSCVKELLKRGAEFGAIDKEYKTVVEKASAAGKCETLEYLVKWEKYEGEPPEEEKTVEEPKKWQPDFSKIDPLYYKLASWMGESQALVQAAGKGEYSVCRSLLEQGADPNSCQKMTPLANAVQGGHREVAKLILMSGADPHKESQKKTPLEYAKEGKFDDIVPLLEAAGLCGGCGVIIAPDQVKRCSKCKIVKFCSVDCQKKCWARFHRKQCNTWAERKDQLNNRKQ